MKIGRNISHAVWNYRNELIKASGNTYSAKYRYDYQGNRSRKVVEKNNIREERYYIGNFEVFRRFVNNSLDYERTSNNLSDGDKVFARVDVKNGNEVLVRYQYDNHLGSACLELDHRADIISYEEYHPFGTTSYRAGRSETEVSLKRYKYCGKERDEETGLYYYGARYYASWLCRWISTDPLKEKYLNLSPYNYCANNPINFIDPDGEDIVVVGSFSYRLQVRRAIRDLRKSEEGNRIIKELSASDDKIVIYNNNKNRNRYMGKYESNETNYHEINFNPADNTPFPKGTAHKDKEIERHPAVSIYHELRHAEQKILGLDDIKYIKEGVNEQSEVAVSMWEVDAIYGENIVRRQLGLDERLLYDGTVITGIEGVRNAARGTYDTGGGRKGSAYIFVKGDYSKNWKTLNNTTLDSYVKIIPETNIDFQPKKSKNFGFKRDDKATTYKINN